MRCIDIMRRPVQTISSGATVQAAASRMADSNIGLLPVCDPVGSVLGVLTDRDIATRVVGPGLPGATSCANVMTKEVVSCSPDVPVDSVARLMSKHRKSRILVMDGDQLVGIVSLSDLAALNSALAALALHDVAAREVVDQFGARQVHEP